MAREHWSAAVLVTLILAAPVAQGAAGDAAQHNTLPPALKWDGKSRTLAVSADHEWATPAEKEQLRATPRYDETMAWLRRLVEAAPELAMRSLGESAQGRDIWMIVASAEQAFTPEALNASDKPLLLAHSGIHSGEIDGKDAGMMLLRDMTVRGTREELLESTNLLFIPILSVDGHERFSRYGRINQRGPRRMGWRTNARNLNLNRDFAKLDTEGVRAVVEVINTYAPDLYLDLHVTDGADYQYDITFGWNYDAWSPAISGWLDRVYRQKVGAALKEWGHTPGPLIFSMNGRDMSDGRAAWNATPRFSTGYGDARHLPTVLVENHSLDPYPRRVLGTYVLLAATMEVLAAQHDSLAEAVSRDRRRRGSELALGWKRAETDDPPTMTFKGVASELVHSKVTGNLVTRWRGEPEKMEIPVIRFDEPGVTVDRPAAYYIPRAWRPIAERLRLHGIEVETLQEPRTVDAAMYRLPEAKLAESGNQPFEGHARVVPGEPTVEQRKMSLRAGAYRVPTDQPLGDLAMLLLEPQSADSYFQWGFFLEILQRTEYVEPYVMAPMAERMLEEDPQLRERFRQKLLDDAEFAGDPQARLQWFYQQTPFYDERYRLYPIGRAMPDH